MSDMGSRLVRRAVLLGAVAAAAWTTPAPADDLRGADRFLCASMEATRCYFDECTSGDPVVWNIPQFVEIDLVEKRVRTTPASGENRETRFTTVVRENDRIILQGQEGGRAFSFVIHEPSGELNAAVAAADSATVVFAVCTPMPAND